MLNIINTSNPEYALVNLLKSLKIDIDYQKVIDELYKHPDYYSLLALSDILNSFNVKNQALTVDIGDLPAIKTPFIAHTINNNGSFVIVHEINNSKVTVSSEKSVKHKITLDDFKKYYNGVILLPELTNKNVLRRRLSIPSNYLLFLAVLLVSVCLIYFHTNYLKYLNWNGGILTLIKFSGSIVSILLLIQSINNENPLVQKLCRGSGQTDCNTILSSSAAKIFKWLSWSELGFFYFSGTVIMLLFGGDSLLNLLMLLNIVCLPYTFYSIYYQAKIIKQWCLLCCAVQVILWLEFLTLSFSNQWVLHYPFTIQWNILIISFMTPVIIWVILKPMLVDKVKLQTLKMQLNGFKYNTERFNKNLFDQLKYVLPNEEWSIVLGNSKPEHVIVMVTNPYCPPCAKSHQTLTDLLKTRPDLQARIVFTAKNSDTDPKTPISRHLMALYDFEGESKLDSALNNWYSQNIKNYEIWAKNFPIDLNEDNFVKLEKQHEWCQQAGITATPTIHLNGYKLPELYQLSDLTYMFK